MESKQTNNRQKNDSQTNNIKTEEQLITGKNNGGAGIKGALIYAFIYTLILVAGRRLLLIYLAAQQGAGDKISRVRIESNNTFGLQIVTGMLVIFVFYFIFDFLKKGIKEEWSLNGIGFSKVFFGSFVGLAFSFGYAFVAYDGEDLFYKNVYDSVDFYGKINSVLGVALMSIALFVVVPISEEIVFRGAVFNRLKENAVLAFLLSTLATALPEVFFGSEFRIYRALALGLVISAVFYFTKSLYGAIIVHIFSNVATPALYFRPYINFPLRIGLAVLCVAVLAVCVYVLYRNRVAD